jgi:hypothetical protein
VFSERSTAGSEILHSSSLLRSVMGGATLRIAIPAARAAFCGSVKRYLTHLQPLHLFQESDGRKLWASNRISRKGECHE